MLANGHRSAIALLWLRSILGRPEYCGLATHQAGLPVQRTGRRGNSLATQRRRELSRTQEDQRRTLFHLVGVSFNIDDG